VCFCFSAIFLRANLNLSFILRIWLNDSCFEEAMSFSEDECLRMISDSMRIFEESLDSSTG
jgi:hypothetical protein